MIGNYLIVEFKRLLRILPAFLAGAAVLAGMLAAAVFCMSGIWYQDQAVERFAIGVVVPSEDQLSSKAVSMIRSLDSVESICDFRYVEEAEGSRLVQAGELSAMLVIPDRMVESIMDGTNTPVRVVMKGGTDIPSQLFRELTRAGMTILGNAQAGIYAMDGYAAEQGLSDDIPHIEQSLNKRFLSYTLSREKLYRTRKITVFGDLSLKQYYLLSAAVVLMMLSCLLLTPMLLPEQRILAGKLNLAGVGILARVCCRWICVMSLLAVLAVPIVFLLKLGGELQLRPQLLLLYLLSASDVAAMALLIAGICRQRLSAVIWMLLLFGLMLFASGAMIPEVFLPKGVRTMHAWIPVSWIVDNLKQVWNVQVRWQSLIPMLLTTPVCILLASWEGGRDHV